jgi:hypothetical protein
VNEERDANRPWDLMSFVQAVTVELDRARDLSRVKSEAGRPLTYLVKDFAINLNVFPVYDGRRVLFRTAGPNEQGASSLKLELGSATAPVVQQTTKPPPRAGDVRVDDLPLDQQTRESLRDIGVESKDDVERLRDVKVRTPRGEVDFSRLAALMDEATAGRPRRPRVDDVVSFRTPGDGNKLRIIGRDLDTIAPQKVLFNREPVDVSVFPEHLELSLPHAQGEPGSANGELVLETRDGDRLRIVLEEAADEG